MLDIKYIRDHVEAVRENIRVRQASADLDLLIRLDDERSVLMKDVEHRRRERNEVAERVSTTSAAERPVL